MFCLRSAVFWGKKMRQLFVTIYLFFSALQKYLEKLGKKYVEKSCRITTHGMDFGTKCLNPFCGFSEDENNLHILSEIQRFFIAKK